MKRAHSAINTHKSDDRSDAYHQHHHMNKKKKKHTKDDKTRIVTINDVSTSSLKHIALYVCDDITQLMLRMNLVCRQWNEIITQFTASTPVENNWQFWRPTYLRYFYMYSCDDEVHFAMQLKQKYQQQLQQAEEVQVELNGNHNNNNNNSSIEKRGGDQDYVTLLLQAIHFPSRLNQLKVLNWKEAFITRYKCTVGSAVNSDKKLASLICDLCQGHDCSDKLLHNWQFIREQFRNLEQMHQYRSLFSSHISNYHNHNLFFNTTNGMAITFAKHKSDERGGSGKNRYEYRIFSQFVPAQFEVVLIEQMKDFTVSADLIVNNDMIAREVRVPTGHERGNNNNNQRIEVDKAALTNLFCEFTMGIMYNDEVMKRRSLWSDQTARLNTLLLEFLKHIVTPPETSYFRSHLISNAQSGIIVFI